MPVKEKHIILREKIIAGIKEATRKLYEERAVKNDTVVISVNGEIKKVPAKELLKKL